MKHAYRQIARAEAAEATASKIVEAFAACAGERWFDEITLEEVAARAEVTVRTLIRRFGGKEGLVRAYAEHRQSLARDAPLAAPGDLEGAVTALVERYEAVGDMAIRDVAQAPHQPGLKPLVEMNRLQHRTLTEAAYAPWLDRLPGPERRRMLDRLVAVTDVSMWKLFRRDMERSAIGTRVLIKGLVEAVLAGETR
jgi:AcrR family transcriptional regulator